MKNTLIILAMLLIPSLITGQDSVSLNVPKTFPTPTSIGTYGPGSILIEFEPKRITIRLIANGELQDPFIYPCPQTEPPATPNECTVDTPAEMNVLLNVVNNGNHTVTSLWRKINIRLAADFPSRFPGGVTQK